MSNTPGRDYIATHQKIRDRLVEKSKTDKRACFDVARLASELKMDIRTVRAHLRIMEIDAVGIFMDTGEKQFCTKNGIAILANMLSVHEKSTE